MVYGIVLLEDDDDTRNVLADLVEAIVPHRCLKLSSVNDLVAHRQEVLSSRLAILDINLGAKRPSGVDAYRWLKQQSFAGRIVFLTGHARSHPLVQEACRLGDAHVYGKPVELDDIEGLLRSALDE